MLENSQAQDIYPQTDGVSQLIADMRAQQRALNEM
jgi:hypothetical protein